MYEFNYFFFQSEFSIFFNSCFPELIFRIVHQHQRLLQGVDWILPCYRAFHVLYYLLSTLDINEVGHIKPRPLVSVSFRADFKPFLRFKAADEAFFQQEKKLAISVRLLPAVEPHAMRDCLDIMVFVHRLFFFPICGAYSRSCIMVYCCSNSRFFLATETGTGGTSRTLFTAAHIMSIVINPPPKAIYPTIGEHESP